jgi:hypothetical protein
MGSELDNTGSSDERTTIAVAICTFKRNDLLTRLLEGLLACADRLSVRSALGVVLVDDTPQGLARPVAEAFADRFELGIHYRISGRQNISLARNLAVETAMEMAEWTVMTDDDCEPPPEWLEALLDAQELTQADAVTGRMVRRVPEGSPRWITEQPFLELGVEELPDGTEMTSAATFNTMISSRWLKAHPDIRFDPQFGVVGGEDMVFFRSACAAGLSVRFSEHGFVYENEPANRTTFAYQLYVYYWHGNSAALSCIESGMLRGRLFIHGAASFVRALARPVLRLARGRPPQLRFALAQTLHATGKLLGTLGVRVAHR